MEGIKLTVFVECKEGEFFPLGRISPNCPEGVIMPMLQIRHQFRLFLKMEFQAARRLFDLH